MKKRLIALMLYIMSAPLLASGESFIVESEIMVGGKTVGSPVIAVISGKEATIAVQGAYNLSLVVTAQENGGVLLDVELMVDGETVSPRMLVKLGQSFGIGVGDIKISMVIRKYVQDGT